MLRLPRLPSNARLVDDKGSPTVAFTQWWQQVVQQVEASINGIQAALDAAGIAQTAADAANMAAASANAATASNAREAALVNSYIDPTSVLTASTTTITIAPHDRHYADGTTVAVGGGSVPASAPSDVDYVSYADPARTGGAVTYIASTVAPVQTGDTHVIGAVTIPASGTQAGGRGPSPPGYVQP